MGPVIYHSGGSIMPRLNIFAIFWKPAALQNGNPAKFPNGYTQILKNFVEDYVGHGIHNNNTQYYQTIEGVTTYVSGLLLSAGGIGSKTASYTDTEPYPAAGCTDVANPGNCITDAQIETELQRVMALKGWTGGLDKVYVIFTPVGEDSCFDAAGQECSSNFYCSYHSYIPGSPNIIYANLPYQEPSFCELPGYTSPNNNPAADTVADDLGHEVSESVTDPLIDAWYDDEGNEIGDLCETSYGTASYDGGLANQSWNGHFYELQEEFDNQTGTCVLIGP